MRTMHALSIKKRPMYKERRRKKKLNLAAVLHWERTLVAQSIQIVGIPVFYSQPSISR